MDNKKIGLFISELRKEQGFNQRELAEKLSVTDKAVSKWETGRGIPDVSILQPLAKVLGVSVGEILNGERMLQQENNDEQLIKKLKIKRYIRLAVEFIITAGFIYELYIFCDTFNGYRNVLDFCLYKNEMMFLSVSTLVLIIIVTVWALTVVISAVFKKKAAVLKTVIVCFLVSFIIGCSLYMAILDDNKILQTYDKPIDIIRYIKYDDFFDDAFDTQIQIKDTNEMITENYSACFDSKGKAYNFVYTDCVTACEYNIVKKYYDQRKSEFAENTNSVEMNKELCEKFEIELGYYTTNIYSENDLDLRFIKGTSYYEIEIAGADIFDEKLAQTITEL